MTFDEIHTGDLLEVTFPIYNRNCDLPIGTKLLIKNFWDDFGLPYEPPYHASILLVDGQEIRIEHRDLMARTRKI